MNTVRLLIIALSVCWALLIALAEETSSEPSEKSTACEVVPMPVGGMTALAGNVVYPETARKEGRQGAVHVKVRIAPSGEIETTEVIQSVAEDLDRAAVEAICKTEWTPGSSKGQPAACEVVLPIQFKLDVDKSKTKDK